MTEIHFTKTSKNHYWTIESLEIDPQKCLIFYSYGKAIFAFNFEKSELFFFRVGWSATTARHARYALERWDERYSLNLMATIRRLIKDKKLRNFKGFLEGTDTLSLRENGGYLFLPHRYGDGLLGYYE